MDFTAIHCCHYFGVVLSCQLCIGRLCDKVAASDIFDLFNLMDVLECCHMAIIVVSVFTVADKKLVIWSKA